MGKRIKIVACKLCDQGRVYIPGRQIFAPCPTCGGMGMLTPENECCCGKPISVKSADDLLFCGNKACLTELRAELKTSQYLSGCGWDRD